MAATLLIVSAAPLAAQITEPPLKQISIGTSIGILFFLLLAALIVVSFLCQILIVVGLVPQKGKLRSVMFWLAKVVSGTRTTKGSDSGSRGSGKGGGGSFGGSGSTGNW